MEGTITRSIDPLCFLEKKSPPPPLTPTALALPEARCDGRWEGRGRDALSHSFILLSRCCWFMLAMHLLYINTDKANQRGFGGSGCPDAAAEKIMSAVSITEINERK